MATSNEEKKKMGFGKIALIVVLAMAVGIVGFYFLTGGGGEEGESTSLLSKRNKVVYDTLEMGSMVVNLKDSGLSNYLRVSPVLQYQQNKKLTEELGEKMPLLEDAMITYLRNKPYSEVRPVEGIEKIKRELKDIVNSNLSQGEIETIYFVEYLLN